jgi:hypothetical protein
MTAVQEQIQAKQYFHPSGTAVVRLTLGKQVMDENKMVHRLGERIAHFQPFGKFGRYITNDPEEQAIMDIWVATGENEIIDYARYLELSTSVEDKLKLSNDKTSLLEEKVRELTVQNDLLRKIAEREQAGKAAR